jgi:hypothetical protein
VCWLGGRRLGGGEENGVRLSADDRPVRDSSLRMQSAWASPAHRCSAALPGPRSLPGRGTTRRRPRRVGVCDRRRAGML